MKYKFNYPSEFTSLPDYSAHRGDFMKIIRELKNGVEYDYEGDKMFEIESIKDGWIGHAFESELELIKN